MKSVESSRHQLIEQTYGHNRYAQEKYRCQEKSRALKPKHRLGSFRIENEDRQLVFIDHPAWYPGLFNINIQGTGVFNQGLLPFVGIPDPQYVIQLADIFRNCHDDR